MEALGVATTPKSDAPELRIKVVILAKGGKVPLGTIILISILASLATVAFVLYLFYH